MRIRIGQPHTNDQQLQPDPDWRRIEGPKSKAAYLAAGLIGVLIALSLIALITTTSILAPVNDNSPPDTPVAVSGAVFIVTIILAILAHELVHVAFHPDHGLSPDSMLIIWPRRLHFGVYYDGPMSRTRWLTMRLAPLVILSCLPSLVLMAASPRTLIIETSLSLLLLVNSLGSGGDVLAAAWVLTHLPGKATLYFRHGRAYWIPVGVEEGERL